VLTGERWRAGGDLREAATRVAVVGAWCGAAALALWAAGYYILGDGVGMDAHAYWLAGRVAHPYGPGPGERDAYLYSPAFAQAMSLPAHLPWHAFLGLAMVGNAAVYYWLLRPLPWRWRVPALLLCVPELLITNIYPLLAAALVLGVARPWAVAFPALTKVTPGSVGVLWFAARGEWRKVALACGTTLAVVAVSFALGPHLWFEWFRFLTTHGGDRGVSYPVRVLLAVGVTIFAARKDRPWLLAIACWLAMPLGGLGPQSGIVLVALVRLLDRETKPTPAPVRAGLEVAPRR
jgi:hypothetical protein